MICEAKDPAADGQGSRTQNYHYREVAPGQSFTIMEGTRQVGEGKIISIEE